MINYSDITFVIQGNFCKEVHESIANIRRDFPGAAIVFSTCGELPKEQIDADHVVKSVDPGYFCLTRKGHEKPNNINRQIVTTLSGLKKVQTEYAFKLRSDFILTGSSFLSFYEKFPQPVLSHKVLSERLLACCAFSRNVTAKEALYPYHPSDVAFFGRTQDILNLFDIPLMEEKNAYFINKKNRQEFRFAPEQWIFLNFLAKNGRQYFCRQLDDLTEQSIFDTQKYFAANFIFLDFACFCLKTYNPRFNFLTEIHSFSSCYTRTEWQALYKEYADSDFVLPPVDFNRQLINSWLKKGKNLQRLCKIICFLIPLRQPRRRARNFLMAFFARLFLHSSYGMMEQK